MGVVAAYQSVLGRLLDLLQAEIEKAFADWESNTVAHFPSVPRIDAAASHYIKQRLGPVRIALEEAVRPGTKLSRDLRTLAARVNKKGDIEFRKVIGISPRGDLGVGGALDAFRDKNVDLIKSLAGQQLDEITDTLAEAESSGLRVEEVRKAIQTQFNTTRSKADLLARDQVLKLNGNLTKVRHEAAGITKYIWTTAGDERVRGNPSGKWPNGMHYDLDGTEQEWSNPPIVSEDGRREHPGGDYQCRCTAFPVLPELDETDDDE
jgi:SPP1 gp7 family putative phage head morphogenesis protein